MSDSRRDRPDEAILILHGIGSQQRYETLDRFATGLKKALGSDVVEPRECTGDASPFDYCVRLDGRRPIDVYEFYWAPYTSAKTSIMAMIRWTFRAGFTPLRRLAYNLGLVSLRARQEAQTGPPASEELEPSPAVDWERYYKRAFRHFFGELWRLVYVLAIGVGLGGGALYLVGKSGTLWKRLWEILGSLRETLFGEWRDLLTVAVFAVAVTLLVALVWSLPAQFKDWKRLYDQWRGGGASGSRREADGEGTSDAEKPDGTKGKTWWQALKESLQHEFVLRLRIFLISMLLLFGLGSLAIVLLFREGPPVAFLPLTGAVHEVAGRMAANWMAVLVVGAGLGAAVLIKKILADYLADIALYTASDERSSFAESRMKILDDACERLAWLLSPEKGYRRVAVAGHSLGSVIAYDAINRLIAGNCRKIEKEKPDLSRLKTFVTFGSPLNKVLYFFRAKVASDQKIRAEILARLGGFRLPRSLLTIDPQIGRDKEGRQLPHIQWVNVSAAFDPISARLAFFDLDPQDEHRRHYWQWGWCHMKYWGDAGFYRIVVDALDHGEREAESAPSEAAKSRAAASAAT